jgi:glycosyltransferase involved in cell wall biosynthesis
VRALFVTRPDAFEKTGGDVTQMLFTKRAVESQGVTVDVAATLHPDPGGYDIAHLFGVYDPEKTQPQADACKRAGVPVALSPLWWDLYEYYGRSRACDRILGGPRRHIDARLERLRGTKTDKLLRHNEKRKYDRRLAWQTALMRAADVLLPNSAIEAHFIRKLRIQDRPVVVVHHAVDVPPVEWTATRRGVVCAARIEQKKNQAMLLYALRGLHVEITLVGGCYEPHYDALCRRFAGSSVRFAGETSRDEALHAMAGAAVHVMPSWAEFPGLSSLEAAAMGARVVVSNNGTEGEYLGEDALYADPEDPGSIRLAVERALSQPPRERGDALQQRIERLTVEAVARRTLVGYGIALSGTAS